MLENINEFVYGDFKDEKAIVKVLLTPAAIFDVITRPINSDGENLIVTGLYTALAAPALIAQCIDGE